MSNGDIVVRIEARLFARLQALARPLVDDINAVLRRMLDSEKASEGAVALAPREFVTLARGERLPVGLRLMSTYGGQSVSARVTAAGIEFDGRTYSSPSAAARAAKLKLGALGNAAHGNGWLFWDYLDEAIGCWSRLEDRRHGGWDESPTALRGSQSGRPAPKPKSLGIGASGTTATSVLAGERRPEPRSWR